MSKRIISVIFIALIILAAVVLNGGFRVLSYEKNAIELGFIESKAEIKKENNGEKNINNVKSETSYASKYSFQDKENAKKIKILFLGDMMFDRNIRLAIEKNGGNFIFEKIDSLLQDNDLVVGNLEGPITLYASVSVKSRMGGKNNFTFTFPPLVSGLLADENIKLVNLGNNHILNFGNAGVKQTREYLTESGVDYFGDSEKRLAIKNIKGLNIAFVSFNQFVAGGEEEVFQDISEAKKSNPDLIFLYAHWGAEYMAKPGARTIALAHKFIDSGVDLVIGSHPHVIQTREEYKDKTIYYSLGNFIFDQYFSEATQEGMAVGAGINLADKKINIQEYSVKMEKSGQTAPN